MGYAKLLIFGALLLQVVVSYYHQEAWWFIQNVNLIFHEAGHIIFFWTGDLFSALGGSFLEILVPLVISLHFYFRQDFFGASFALWWLSTALLSVSIYVSDSQERILPLITNDVSTHDWFTILNQMHLLKYDNEIGSAFLFFGILSIISSVNLFIKDKDVVRLFHRH